MTDEGNSQTIAPNVSTVKTELATRKIEKQIRVDADNWSDSLPLFQLIYKQHFVRKLKLRDARLPFRTVGHLQVDRFDRQLWEVLGGDDRCVLLCSVVKSRRCLGGIVTRCICAFGERSLVDAIRERQLACHG